MTPSHDTKPNELVHANADMFTGSPVTKAPTYQVVASVDLNGVRASQKFLDSIYK